jgi:hypothetical protein
MLMTIELTARARALLETLQRGNDWMNRSKLAIASGKSGRLSPHDLMLLERMANEGLIEIRDVPGKSPVGKQYEYRAKQAE